MERKRFWEQSWLGLRALAVIAVMLLTTVTASATDYFVAEYDGSTLTFKKTTTAPDNSSSWDVSDTGTSNPGWYSYCEGIWKVVFDPSFAEAHPKNCSKWFEGCERPFSIEGLKFLNTSEVTNMNGMFNGCSSLTSLDLSSFNTDKVTNMSYMFSGCSGLTSLVLSNFNTGKVTNMSYMFSGCSSLTSLDISTFNTGNVTKMNKMFQACNNLMTIFASNNFTIANVESGSDMFKDCTKLVGGKGTTYNQDKTRYTYARLDGGSGNPGYFANIDEDLINLTLLNGVTTPTPLINNGHSYTTGTKITLSYTAPTGYTFNGFKAMKTSDGTDVTANVISESTLTMPNYPVTVSAKLYVKNVPYMTWDDSKKKLVEATTPDGTPVHVLQGGAATTLGAGWYVAEGDVTYTDQLRFNGNAHLILADGCNLTVGTEANPITGPAIFADACDLTIYGQGGGTEGMLTATSSSNHAVYAFNNSMDARSTSITINGGKVKAIGRSKCISASNNNGTACITVNGGQVEVTSTNSYGIYAYSKSHTATITINGGQLTATGDTDGIYADSELNSAAITINGGQVTATGGTNGIYADGYYSANITINGGQLTATGDTNGIHALNHNGPSYITLGWTKATDFIKASSYKIKGTGSVKTAAGKRFVAYNMASEDDISANCIIGSATSETTLNSTDINNIAGKTLRPLDGYVVKDMAGLTFSGKTAPDFTISDKPYYIYKADDEVTLSTDKNYGQDGIFFNTSPDNAIADATAASGSVVTTKTFAMPAQDVTINGLKYYNTGVKYMDWDDTQKTLVEKTTNANDKVYILTGGGETTLPGGWYVVNNWNTAADNDGHSIDAAYTGKLRFNGATHLILADGAEMSVDIQGGDRAINLENSDVATLDIYGQAQGSGALTAKSASYNAIRIYSSGSDGTASLTINGGQVTATGDINGIYVIANRNGTASVTVNGGEVAAGGDYAIVAESNIGNAYVTINGGEVDATGGFNGIYAIANGNGTASITLGWTNATDYIYASSYKAEIGSSGTASVKTAAGKALACTIGEYTTVMGSTDATDYIFGAAGNTTLEYIAGQTLRPAKTLPVAGSASYVALYQDQGDWQVTDPDTKIYVPTGSIIKNGNAYEMELQEVTGGGIPDGKPVIVGKEGGLNGIPVRGTSADEANTIETNYTAANPSPAFFVGDGTKTLNELIIAALGDGTDPTDYIAFTLIGDKLVALDNSGAAVKAGVCIFVISKLYVLQMVQGTYAPSAGARQRGIPFDLGGDATGIESVANVQSSMFNGQWFDLQGRRLDQAPKAKGVYIRNGIQVVVK